MTKEELSRKYADERRIPDESRANVQFNCFELQQAYEDGYDRAVELACEFMKSYRQDTFDGTGYIAGVINDKTIEDFKKKMEEGV